MSFPDEREDIFYDVILEEGMPRVEVFTYGDTQSSRVVWGKVTSGSLANIQQMAPQIKTNSNTLLVRFGRDVSHAKGGVANPSIGDWIQRAGDATRYSYKGRITDADAHSHTLEFERVEPAAIGKTMKG